MWTLRRVFLFLDLKTAYFGAFLVFLSRKIVMFFSCYFAFFAKNVTRQTFVKQKNKLIKQKNILAVRVFFYVIIVFYIASSKSMLSCIRYSSVRWRESIFCLRSTILYSTIPNIRKAVPMANITITNQSKLSWLATLR